MANSVEKTSIGQRLASRHTQWSYSYVAHYKDITWDEGGLTTDTALHCLMRKHLPCARKF